DRGGTGGPGGVFCAAAAGNARTVASVTSRSVFKEVMTVSPRPWWRWSAAATKRERAVAPPARPFRYGFFFAAESGVGAGDGAFGVAAPGWPGSGTADCGCWPARVESA